MKKSESNWILIYAPDCEFDAGCGKRRRITTSRLIQAHNLMETAVTGLQRRVAGSAMRLKNSVRPRGIHQLDLPCERTGTGMPRPWKTPKTEPSVREDLAENLQLSIAVAAQGAPPLFCESASVSSRFPTNAEIENSNNRRRVRGHVELIIGSAPQLIWHCLRTRSAAMTMMTITRIVQPLAQLTFATYSCNQLVPA